MWTKLILDLQSARTEEELKSVIEGDFSIGQLGCKQLIEATIGHAWMIKEYCDMGIEVDESEFDIIESNLEFLQRVINILSARNFENLLPVASVHLIVKSLAELSFTTGRFDGIEQQLRETTRIPKFNHSTGTYDTITLTVNN